MPDLVPRVNCSKYSSDTLQIREVYVPSIYQQFPKAAIHTSSIFQRFPQTANDAQTFCATWVTRTNEFVSFFDLLLTCQITQIKLLTALQKLVDKKSLILIKTRS